MSRIEDLQEFLRDIDAEPAFRRWCGEIGSLSKAWEVCERADWMLHLLEHSGEPNPNALRDFCHRTIERFLDHIPEACREAVRRALADGKETLDDTGRPVDKGVWDGARATVVAAEDLNRAVGNWTPARVLAILTAYFHADPVIAACGVSEQAGIAAQYIHPFPTPTDWVEELARQAADLREIFGNPFQNT
jgi:hypothetical protein